MYVLQTFDSPVLRQRSRPVTRVGPNEKELLKTMVTLMRKHGGVGLAAPQIGISRRMIVVEHARGLFRLINPQIMRRTGQKIPGEEGCLSLPGITVTIRRAREILVKAVDISGKSVTIKAQGVLARILQHEIDHLDGKLIIDYLPWYRRMFPIRRRTVRKRAV